MQLRREFIPSFAQRTCRPVEAAAVCQDGSNTHGEMLQQRTQHHNGMTMARSIKVSLSLFI